MGELSPVQQSCTNLNSEAELVVGSIYGMRQWTFHNFFEAGEPGLWGHWDFRWNVSGVNEAVCEKDFEFVGTGTIEALSIEKNSDIRTASLKVSERVLQAFEDNPGAICIKITLITAKFYQADDPAQHWQTCLDVVSEMQQLQHLILTELRVEALVPKAKHKIADPACECGFYAFTDAESLFSNSYQGGACVLGIVRAWGMVTVGTKGFRSQYAEIVGLTVPLKGRYDWRVGRKKWSPTYVAREYNAVIPSTMSRYSDVDDLINRYEELTA